MPPNHRSSLESILLTSDRRQMSQLRPYLPSRYCTRAARHALEHAQRVIITSGFYLTHLDAPETDGPPGALAVGRALQLLGGQVTYVTDRYALDLFRRLSGDSVGVMDFPITGLEESNQFATQLLDRVRPTLMISIERCGVTAMGIYTSARGVDITARTARLDTLFQHGLPSIGIGDGGNEIGMGKLAAVIPTIPGLPTCPAVTATDDLIIASTSNWGGYGLVAALSVLTGKNLLPTGEAEAQLLRDLFELNCYDGTRDTPTCGVDGFSAEENSALLAHLSAWIAAHG